MPRTVFFPSSLLTSFTLNLAFLCLLISIQALLLAFDSVATIPFILRVLYLKVPLQQNCLMKEEQEQKVCFVFAIFYSSLRCERLYFSQDFRWLTLGKKQKTKNNAKLLPPPVVMQICTRRADKSANTLC